MDFKVEEFINIKQGNISVEEYSLKFSILSKYYPSLVSDPRDEMSMSDKCRRSSKGRMLYTMLHSDMTLARLMVYAKSIEVSKLNRMSRNLKRGDSSDQDDPRFNKRAQTQEEPRSAKMKFDIGGGSQNEKSKCVTCGKSHYGKYLDGTSCCFDCGNNDHKVRDCPTIVARGREAKQVASNIRKDDAPNNRYFYALWTRGENSDDDDDE